MNPFKITWLAFKDFAFKLGYTEKVVGDYTFRRNRSNPKAATIKLISSSTKNRTIITRESNGKETVINW